MQACLRYFFASLGLIISALYLLNLSAGFIEIPDNLPIVGNLDEVFFSGLFFSCLSVFGLRLPMSKGPKSHDTPEATLKNCNPKKDNK